MAGHTPWRDVKHKRDIADVEPKLGFCGHPLSAVVQSAEGTAYCSACEDEARERTERAAEGTD